MTRLKLAIIGLVLITLVPIIAYFSIMVGGDYVDDNRCRPFTVISNDGELNAKLRSDLTAFVNDQENLGKIEQIISFEFQTYTALDFENSFPWLVIFDKYPVHQRQLELALRFDPKMRKPTPPYRIAEVGLYSSRSLLMYKNENPDQYMGGAGAVRLSEKPYVQCPVSFSRGVPVE